MKRLFEVILEVCFRHHCSVIGFHIHIFIDKSENWNDLPVIDGTIIN